MSSSSVLFHLLLGCGCYRSSAVSANMNVNPNAAVTTGIFYASELCSTCSVEDPDLLGLKKNSAVPEPKFSSHIHNGNSYPLLFKTFSDKGVLLDQT